MYVCIHLHTRTPEVPKQLYEFPDYPLEKVAWGEYATGAQTQDYFEQINIYIYIYIYINDNR